ncbi:MAG: response regulator [Bacteroidia bacterium]|nr:response regulator [Bacteroidia bacterium]
MNSKLSFDTKILIAIIMIIVAVGSIGFYAYRSMNNVIAAIIKQASPNEKLLLLKGVTINLNEAENYVKTYSFSANSSYIDSFKIAKANTYIKIKQLNKLTLPNAHQKMVVDSLDKMIGKRFLLLEQIQRSGKNYTYRQTLDKVYEKIVTEKTTSKQEIKSPLKKRKTFLKKIFGTQQMQKNSAVEATPAISRNQLQKELAEVKKEESTYEQRKLNKQLNLNQKDELIMDQINVLIKELESAEAIVMIGKTGEVQSITGRANNYILLIISVICILLIILAITILRYLQKGRIYNFALQAAKSDTEELFKVKQNFFTRMSHEIRTPITAIIGFTDQVLNTPLTKEQNFQLAIVKKSGEHLLVIANEILDLSKLESGKLKTILIPFDPNEILNEIFVMMQNEARQKQLIYTLSSDKDTPSNLIGDPMRLKQVLLNVLGNAIKFTDKGEVSITYSSTKTGDKNILLNILVKDSGIGIANSRIEKVFNEFEQADEHTSLKFGGTGLGLNISQKLLKLLNGNIELKSEENQGTLVIISVPFAVGEKPVERIKLQVPEAFNEVQILKGKSILIVDDNEYNQLLFSTILKSTGVLCDQAINGKIAIDLHVKNNYDVILMDLIMPEMNGIEATTYIRTQLKGQKANVPIIALTALGSDNIVTRAREAGINDMLNKPFKKQDLYKKILTVLKIFPPHSNENIAKTQVPSINTIEAPPFNLQDLYRVAGNDKSFIKDMIDVFIRTTREGMVKVKYFTEQKEWENLANAAHKISAPCKHIEAKLILGLIKQIEDNARSLNNIDKIEALVIQLEMEAESLIILLEKEITK